jgi:hypothetical protein
MGFSKSIFRFTALSLFLIIFSINLSADNASVPKINLQVSIIDENVKIEWTSFTVDGEFMIEVANHTDENGKLQFTQLTKIKANGSYTYQFIDKKSEKSGLLYYRVIENTNDGTEIISDMATANFTLKDIFTSNVRSNPGFSAINVQINSKSNGQVMIKLTDLQGMEILSISQLINEGFNNLNITPEDQFAIGMYILSIQLNGGSQKILLENKIEENISLSTE